MTITGFHAEVLLAAGYALFLVAVAASLELLARHSHSRAAQFHVAGFKYHQQFDVWECPTGQSLSRTEHDHERRLVRYRAPSHACNSCPVKSNCTDSNDGREIERRLDSWLESETGRFHRGISLALLLLAGLILTAEIARHDTLQELLVLGVMLLPISSMGVRLFTRFLGR